MQMPKDQIWVAKWSEAPSCHHQGGIYWECGVRHPVSPGQFEKVNFQVRGSLVLQSSKIPWPKIWRSWQHFQVLRSSHTPPQSLNGSSVIISNSRFEHVSPIVWFQMDCELPSPFNVSELNVWKTTRQLLVGSGEEDFYLERTWLLFPETFSSAFFRFHTYMEQCGKENFLQPFEFPPDWANTISAVHSTCP